MNEFLKDSSLKTQPVRSHDDCGGTPPQLGSCSCYPVGRWFWILLECGNCSFGKARMECRWRLKKLSSSQPVPLSDCAHRSEPGCAVREALAAGTLDAERFQSYEKLKREMRYLALRQVASLGDSKGSDGKQLRVWLETEPLPSAMETKCGCNRIGGSHQNMRKMTLRSLEHVQRRSNLET